MPTNPAAISSLAKAIATAAEQSATGEYSTKEQLAALVISAEKLAIAAREPEENVYCISTQVCSPELVKNFEILIIWQVAQNAAIRSVIEMGVFDEMPLDGSPVSVETLAVRLKVDQELLGIC